MPPLDSPFQPFGVLHGAAVAAFVVVVTPLVLLRRRLRGTASAEKLDIAIAIIATVIAIATNGVWLLPANFSVARSLPLHICDLCTFIAPLALTARWRGWRALLYFFGLGLSTWGFITPDLRSLPHEPGFWLFWAAHFCVVGIAIYDLIARHYRPARQDLRIAMLGSAGYVMVVLPIDRIFNVNYGYLGVSDTQPGVILMLGSWPWRLPVIMAVVLLQFAAMTFIWDRRRRQLSAGIYRTD